MKIENGIDYRREDRECGLIVGGGFLGIFAMIVVCFLLAAFCTDAQILDDGRVLETYLGKGQRRAFSAEERAAWFAKQTPPEQALASRQNTLEAQVRERADVLVERGFTAGGVDFALYRIDREKWMANAMAAIIGADLSDKEIVGKKGKSKQFRDNAEYMATFLAGMAVINGIDNQSGSLRKAIWAEGQTQAGLDALEKSAAWQGFFQDEEVTK